MSVTKEAASFKQFSTVHDEAVMCVASVSAGQCVTASKDKVNQIYKQLQKLPIMGIGLGYKTQRGRKRLRLLSFRQDETMLIHWGSKTMVRLYKTH